jgi:hypothetical protein
MPTGFVCETRQLNIESAWAQSSQYVQVLATPLDDGEEWSPCPGHDKTLRTYQTMCRIVQLQLERGCDGCKKEIISQKID